MSASRRTQRILQEIHRASLDEETRDHRAALETDLARRHAELYGDRPSAARLLPEGRAGRRWRLAAAALGLAVVALGAGALPVDDEVPLGHQLVLEVPGTPPDGLPPLPALLEACERLSEAASVSVDVAASAGGSTVTVLLLGDPAGPDGPADPAARLVDGLRRLYPGLGAATVASRELVGVFPRSLAEVLGRRLLSVELDAGDLAAARRAILTTLGGRASDVQVEALEDAGGRRTVRVRIEPAE